MKGRNGIINVLNGRHYYYSPQYIECAKLFSLSKLNQSELVKVAPELLMYHMGLKSALFSVTFSIEIHETLFSIRSILQCETLEI